MARLQPPSLSRLSGFRKRRSVGGERCHGRRTAAAVSALGLCLGGVALAGPAAASYGPSGLAGGGSVNAIALAPDANCQGTDSNNLATRDLLAGGDVFGLNQSGDGGESWLPQNDGVASVQQNSVAAVAFEPAGTEAYAWVGRDVGAPGALLVAAACGTGTWSQVYPGTGDVAPVLHSNGHRPREVGHLLVPLSQTLMLAGASNGLFEVSRTTPTGTWCAGTAVCKQLSILAADEIRAIAQDPNNANVVYVSYGPGPDDPAGTAYGVVRVVNSGGTFSVGSAQLAGSSTSPGAAGTPHDVVAVDESSGTKVYVARGTNGVSQCNTTGSTLSCSSSAFGMGLPPAGEWTSLAAMPDPTAAAGSRGALIFAGCTADDNGANCSPTSSTIYYKSAATGWQPAVPGTTSLSYNLLTHNAPSTTPWWLSFATNSMLPGVNYTASQLQLDGDSSAGYWLFSAGRAGVWRAKVTGLSLSGTVAVGSWHPASNGLSGDEVWSVSADGNHNVGVGDTDWAGLASTNDLGVDPQPIRASSGGTVYATVLNQGRLFLGEGQKDFGPDPRPGASHVWACDPQSSTLANPTPCGDPTNTFIDLGVPGTNAGGVIGLAAGQTAAQAGSGASEVVAATEDQGVWVRSNTGSWRRITDPNAGTMICENAPANYSDSVIWSTGAKYLFVYDPFQGKLFRSPDLLANSGLWTSGFWAFTTVWTSGAPDKQGTGYVVGDQGQQGQPAQPTALWASTNSGAYELTTLGLGTVTATALTLGGTQVSPTGPIAIDRPPTGTADSVLLTRTIDQGVGLGLWSTNPGGTTLNDVSGPAFYDQAFRMSDITVVYTGSGATLTRHSYIANHEGGGVLVNPAPAQ